jgi:hypothetical protein
LPLVDWLPLLVVGGVFTTLGLVKAHGFRHNVVGGGGRPWRTRVHGSCPTWSRHLNVTITVVLLGIGCSFLSILGWLLLTAGRR